MNPEAGWYEDPTDPSLLRYWDGGAWTDHTRERSAVVADDPSTADAQGEDADDADGESTSRVADRSVDWPEGDWCRSCGEGSILGEFCGVCGWPMNPYAQVDTRIGLVYSIKVRMRSRLAICVAENPTEITVMIDAKTEKVIPISEDLQPETDVIPVSLSTAGRLRLGADIAEAGVRRVKWDADQLRQQALSVVDEDRLAQRRLYDEALEHGWEDLQHGLPLSGSEKAWRAAHEMADRELLEPLRDTLVQLPSTGYESRSGLVLPLVSQILASDERAAFCDLVQTWDASLPFAESLQTVLGVQDDHAEFGRAAEELVRLAPVEGFSEGMLTDIEDGRVPEPVSANAVLWTAYHAYDDESTGTVDPQQLAVLPMALVDDLVDADRVDQLIDVDPLPEGMRETVLARLRPDELTEEELKGVGHQDELARRYFLSRDSSSLGGLDPRREAVVHYKALSALRNGESYDDSDLREAERVLLADFISAMGAITAGETPFMPSEVLGDPTLWPALQDLALANRIMVTEEQRSSLPRFADWIDLHAMIALLWQGNDHDVAHTIGSDLVARLTDEELRDEALNLRAFALWRQGQLIEALDCMEDAMQGAYTEALLVNTSIIATACEPTIAARYLGKLVAEAPSTDLRIAALHRSVGIWQSQPDLEFPASTAQALRQVIRLNDLSEEDYYAFMNLASRVDAEQLASGPPPVPLTAEKRVTHDVFVTRAKAYQGQVLASDYSERLIEVNRGTVKPPWLRSLTDEWIDFLTSGLMEDFGKPMGFASGMDAFIRNGRDLLAPNTYLYFAPQCGAHFAWNAWNNGNRLSDEAAVKFFYEPIERFAVDSREFPEKVVEILGHNFHMCLISYATREYVFGRGVSDENTSVYNEFNQRRRWDHENRYAIVSKMREILAVDQQIIDGVKRIVERAERFTADPENPSFQEVHASLVSDLRVWQDEIIRLRANL